ncbi:rod shape-determining protein MreC [Candidatus Daviesbacteria bacterium]|nr:rod shape-determining protein MreC [Candidatus Daviesbacteria bacterium]
MDKVIPDLKLFLYLLIISILILVLDQFRLLNLTKSLISYLTNPISFGLYQTNQKLSRQFYFVFEARFAAQENKALKEQIGKLLSENTQLRKKLAETESLVSQSKYLDTPNYNLIVTRPIGLSRFLKVDKGSNSNLKLGEAVIFNNNYIGKIVQIFPKSANVQLLIDPDSKVAAFSQGLEGRAKGVLAGQFGTEMLMDKILHEEKIKLGDLVYSEGTEGFLPRGLILGRVSQILERENEVFKQAKVQPVFDIRDLELVFVIGE